LQAEALVKSHLVPCATPASQPGLAPPGYGVARSAGRPGPTEGDEQTCRRPFHFWDIRPGRAEFIRGMEAECFQEQLWRVPGAAEHDAQDCPRRSQVRRVFAA